MGVYIKDMEMPKDRGVFVFVGVDGFACVHGDTVLETTAIPVPPHGRLIDADALRAQFPEPSEKNGGWQNSYEALVHKTGIWAAIDCAPTIIPACKEVETGGISE